MARDLVPGDTLVTRIGRAPVRTVRPKGMGLEVVLDVDAPSSTRAPAQGSVLFFWPGQPVEVAGNASAPRVPLPLAHDRRGDGRHPRPGAAHATARRRPQGARA